MELKRENLIPGNVYKVICDHSDDPCLQYLILYKGDLADCRYKAHNESCVLRGTFLRDYYNFYEVDEDTRVKVFHFMGEPNEVINYEIC